MPAGPDSDSDTEEKSASRVPRGVLIAAIAFAAVIAAAVLINAFSSKAVPGDSLYSVKRSFESARSYLVLSRSGSAEFALMLAERRIDEARLLENKDRAEARKLLDEADDQIEAALAAAEFLLEQEQVDRIIADAERVRSHALSIRKETSPISD